MKPEASVGLVWQFAKEKLQVLFFVLASAFGWLAYLPLVVSRSGIGWVPTDVPIQFVLIGAFSPTGAALCTQWLARRNLRICRYTRPKN